MSRLLIRNFSIIAHIDHGKSTLADRFLELTNAISAREKSDRLLDNMDIEKERGITIKAQTVRLQYKARNGQCYFFNLIDTPGHVDFSYEVSRSLASCDGALLVVDASEGVKAQTLANVSLALEYGVEIIPVLNKVDLPHASTEEVKREIEDIIGLETDDAFEVSAKTGQGVDSLLEGIVRRIPPPEGSSSSPLRALIFDSWFDSYRGAIVLVRVFEGKVSKGDQVYFKNSHKFYEVLQVAVNNPFFCEIESLSAGDVGILICGIKTLRDIKIGDTIVHAKNQDTPNLPGYREMKPMVFCGIFPVDASDYSALRESLEKLALNDSSFTYEPENSKALNLGLRCGFLGPLHMNIIQERLEREFSLNLISTAPSCRYRVTLSNGSVTEIDNPGDLPSAHTYELLEEPLVKVSIHTPAEFIGVVMKICNERRGVQENMEYLTEKQTQITYILPLNEMILDFYDKLKGHTQGHASMDYELAGYGASNLVKVDILINGEIVDALSLICHRDQSQHKGRGVVEKLRKIIPRGQFDIAIQAAIGSKIVARETVKALRKNVLAKCYGGDITRKRKLLEKQKAGKKRMKMVGHVEIPQEAFLAVLKVK